MSVRSRRGGFTLVEMLVVLAIIGVVMSVVFTNQGTFNKTLILTTTAYDVALTLRDASMYGLGSRAAGTSANTAYGVHFTQSTPTSFVLYADTSPAPSCSTPDCKPGDGVYTSGSDSLVRTYTLGNGISITDFCAYVNGWVCTSARGGAGDNLTTLDVAFGRPNPAPVMNVQRGSTSYSAATTACLVLSSSSASSRYIAISSVGQVSVNSTSCP